MATTFLVSVFYIVYSYSSKFQFSLPKGLLLLFMAVIEFLHYEVAVMERNLCSLGSTGAILSISHAQYFHKQNVVTVLFCFIISWY